MNKLKKITLCLAGFVLLGVVLIFAINLSINLYAARFDQTDLPQCDAILVLGAYVHPDGTPSPVLQDRLDNALHLYDMGNGKAPKIIVSGDHGTRGYDEVNSMLQYLLGKGVPQEDVFLDHAGFDTFDSIYRARDIFGVQSMIISTQAFHMPRSIYIARRLGIDAYGYPAADKDIYNMTSLNFRESLAKVKAVLDVEVLKSKPKFLGEPFDLAGSGLATIG